jgi:hypothetical protein
LQRNLILLIGQSNMAGRGPIHEVPAITHPHIDMFRNDQWQRAEEPLHTDKSTAGIGLAMSFAVDYLKAFPEAQVGLIPSAVGGTPLSRWMPGNDLYENAVSMAKRALESGSLKGILWHQGENDSQDLQNTNTYGQRFATMISALRTELNAENVPFIAGELGEFLASHATCIYYTKINEAQKQQTQILPHCAFASAKDLTDHGDGVHFDSASLREFGRRYAAEYFRVING